MSTVGCADLVQPSSNWVIEANGVDRQVTEVGMPGLSIKTCGVFPFTQLKDSSEHGTWNITWTEQVELFWVGKRFESLKDQNSFHHI